MKNNDLCDIKAVYEYGEVVDIIFRTKQYSDINEGYLYKEFHLKDYVPKNLSVRNFCRVMGGLEYNYELNDLNYSELNLSF